MSQDKKPVTPEVQAAPPQPEGKIRVEVVYGLPDEQTLVSLYLPEGANVEQAILASGLLSKYPQIDLQKNSVGIFSKVTKLSQPLRDRDRVEIYRPLIADPKEVRRKRAEKAKQTKK